MRDTRLKQLKRKGLYSLYKQGLLEGRFTSLRKASEWLSTQPAPCFYISPEQAYKGIGWIKANRSLVHFNASQRRLLRRLWNDYKEYLESHPDNKRSCIDIMDELVQRPAPEFYMEPAAIRRMLAEEIEETKSQMGWGA